MERNARARIATVAALGMVAAGAAAMLWVLPALLGLLGGAAPAVASALALAARPPVHLSIAGAETPLVGNALRFERVTVTEEGPARARAVSTLDFEGALGPTRVSSLGRETTRFRRSGAGWEVEGGLAPTLAGAVAALAARARALERGDAAALAALVAPRDREQALADPGLHAALGTPSSREPIQAWYLRSEAGEITVTEEAGAQARTRRLRLVPREPGSSEFVFAGLVL